MAGSSPGPWLRLTALAAAGAGLLVVASGGLDLAHRALALVALPALVAVVVAACVAHRALLPPAAAALALFLGAVASWWSRPLHLALAALALAAALVSAAATFRGERAPRGSARDYLTLMKPRVMSLLLVTGACGMFVGAGGVPPLLDLAVMLAGLALACGGASALNHVLDRDIDRLMGKRTERRPVAAGRIPPARALEFGLALSAFSFVLLSTLANPLTAVLALVGNLFYVLVYTRWLKRATPQNIVIGGAAGAVPPLVGWAAATGDLTLPALFLFLVVFVWTPPHFWALALLIRREYAAANVPMLPVVRGEGETTRQIVLYTVGLVALTLLPLAWGMFGATYGVAAALLGALFLRYAWRLRRDPTPRRAAVLFHYSLAYLALLFVAMAVDPLVL
ncbi:MAG TPA: heme o synthase [Gaiellaceae bacterium]|nr:heme o synthase [Gaiellaceae bacterium]